MFGNFVTLITVTENGRVIEDCSRMERNDGALQPVRVLLVFPFLAGLLFRPMTRLKLDS